MCFQVYFKPSHRYIERELESSAKKKASLRNSYFAITPSNSLFLGGEMSIKEKDFIPEERVKAQKQKDRTSSLV